MLRTTDVLCGLFVLVLLPYVRAALPVASSPLHTAREVQPVGVTTETVRPRTGSVRQFTCRGYFHIMTGLDGIYRHDGATTQWDESGVMLAREGRVARLSWEDILGVRRLGARPGYVQLIVKGHVPAQRLSEDHFSIPVNSDSDANRLDVTLGWQARGHEPTPEDAT